MVAAMNFKFFPLSLALTSIFLFSLASPVQAGFEWTPAPLDPAPTAMGAGTGLTPDMPAIPTGNVDASVLQAPGGVSTPPALDPNPLARSKPPVMDSEQAESPTPSESIQPISQMANAVGFGSDIPMALAMRQIVPPDYGFSFDPSVDQGMRITWSGGSPWDIVLNDALRPAGLEANVVGNTVRVQPALPEQPILTVQDDPVMEPLPVVPEAMVSEASPPTEEKVQEVYIRRNSNEHDSIGRTSGSPGAERDKESGFWEWLGIEPSSGDYVSAQSMKKELPVSNRVWSARQGDSLKDVIRSWADSADVALVWTASQDYTVGTPLKIQGSFDEAVMDVLSEFDDAEDRPVGKLHAGSSGGQTVLVIESEKNS